MRRIASILLVLAWGLWFGGLIVLFIAISSLFKALASRHDLAGLGASQIFRVVNIYQLVLAAATLLATLGCRPRGGSRSSSTLLIFLSLATAFDLVVSAWLGPQLENMRLAELTHTAQFARLHGWSMGFYMIECLFLLSAGVVIPFVIERPRHALGDETARNEVTQRGLQQ